MYDIQASICTHSRMSTAKHVGYERYWMFHGQSGKCWQARADDVTAPVDRLIPTRFMPGSGSSSAAGVDTAPR